MVNDHVNLLTLAFVWSEIWTQGHQRVAQVLIKYSPATIGVTVERTL